jgi:voltage-gated potassium channel
MKPLLIRFSILVGILLLIIGVGTVGFIIVENMSPLDAFYFTVVTVATVGYGDVHPITEAGKILAVFVIVAGVGTFSAVIINSAGLIFEGRQNEVRRQRNNVLIGLFFSEVGTPLLEQLIRFDPGIADIQGQAIVHQGWTASDFVQLSKKIESHEYILDHNKIEFERLKSSLGEKTDFLIRLIESPTLLEHESFTEILWATLHLREELFARKSFHDLPETDISHLVGDSKRVYVLLARMWVNYMRYLKNAYPYLFSLAVRNNPFDEKRSPIVI